MSGKERARHYGSDRGMVLVVIIVAVVILNVIGVGLLMVAYGVRHDAVVFRNDVLAVAAAEAGYERAIFWMSQQPDLLTALQNGDAGGSGSLAFSDSRCSYEVRFDSFMGRRPIFRVICAGSCGNISRIVDVQIIQAVSGWAMGLCRVPSGTGNTTPVYFADGEIIDIPLHINQANDSPDERDIFITGDPEFQQAIAMGESRHTDGGTDKYNSVMDTIDSGIYFDQPETKITDETAVQTKVNRFRDSTKMEHRYNPNGTASVSNPNDAVQIEFFVQGGTGKMRITNNCTVMGYQRSSSDTTWDYQVVPGSGATQFQKYDTYGYHYVSDSEPGIIVNVEDTYVTQQFGGYESEPGGQIYVDGNVIIGGADTLGDGNRVAGQITVVASGNIWIADSVELAGAHDNDTGMPSVDNPNVLGLISQGVIKVVDPGVSSYSSGWPNYYPGPPTSSVPDAGNPGNTHSYRPIGGHDGGASYNRHLPDPLIVEGALTVGGGGWGAENVRRRAGGRNYGGRKETTGSQDHLVVRGTISEVIRGVVGLIGSDGFVKQYFLDERMLEGILPGALGLQGKYVPAPSGWSDYRVAHDN